jgi:hypothetical protein
MELTCGLDAAPHAGEVGLHHERVARLYPHWRLPVLGHLGNARQDVAELHGSALDGPEGTRRRLPDTGAHLFVGRLLDVPVLEFRVALDDALRQRAAFARGAQIVILEEGEIAHERWS